MAFRCFLKHSKPVSGCKIILLLVGRSIRGNKKDLIQPQGNDGCLS